MGVAFIQAVLVHLNRLAFKPPLLGLVAEILCLVLLIFARCSRSRRALSPLRPPGTHPASFLYPDGRVCAELLTFKNGPLAFSEPTIWVKIGQHTGA